MSDSKHVTYEDAGVDTAEGGRAVDAIKQMVKDTNRPEVIGGIGGFGGLFSAAALKDMEDPILISGTDGVGTKLVLAQIMDRHETVGQDLVAMCVNDILASGAEPLFFLDYVAIGHIEAEHMAKIIKGVADGCKLAGCALVGGEMAEHPGVMAPADYDLAGFTVGVVDRPKMLDPANVRPRSVNHSRPVALNIAERARNNITDTVNHPNLKACVIRKIYLYRIFGDELRLGRHYCSAGGGLR